MWSWSSSASASCELIGRSSKVYVVGGCGEGRYCPSKSIKFKRVPSVACCKLINPSRSSGLEPEGRAINGASRITTKRPPHGYRRNVGICLVNPSQMVFMASRIHVTGLWQMPQGGAKSGEDLLSAAMRELQEETGVTSAEYVAEAPYWMSYDFPTHKREMVNRRWGTNYKGQTQKWFLFKFTGKEEEINLSGNGSERPEFQHWSWILADQVVDFAVDFKKEDYRELMELFSPYLKKCGDAKPQNPVWRKSLDDPAAVRQLKAFRMADRLKFGALSH
ncbi:Nudix hydrolase 27, chloroplastic [Linum grandiflorum]